MPRPLASIAAHLLREKYDNALLVEIETAPNTPLEAPVAADTGAGNVPAGTWKWAYAFVDNAGYESGELSPASNALTSGTPFKANITIARGPATVEKRRIYRSESPYTTWTLVVEIADNTTTAYEDNNATTGAAFAAQYLRYTNSDRASLTLTVDDVSRTFGTAGVGTSGLGQAMTTGLEEVSLSLWNVDGAWSNYILKQGARGRRVQIWEAYWDIDSGSYVGYTKLHDGRIDEVELDEDHVSFTVTPHTNPWTLRFPGMTFTVTCGLRFKGKWCQYVGPELTCDRTYEACLVYANTIHFLGFRTLPDIGKKIIWGGQGTKLPPPVATKPFWMF